MEETPQENQDAPEQPQRPVAQCPVQTCDWTIQFPESGDLEELEPVLREHTDSHSAQEFMNTIGMLQGALFDSHGRIAELEGALRGALFTMQSAGIVPGPPGAKQPEVPEGLYVPQSAVEGGGKLILPGKTPQRGDIVPGRGELVGKKITDPKILKQLRRGRNGSG